VSGASRSPSELRIFGVTGIGEVRAGDDLGTLLLDALRAAGEELFDDDVLVVSSKIVSKAEGRLVEADDREAQILAETVRPVAARRTPHGVARIVQAAAGPVMAAAGVDASNVAPGVVLLLPKDPDASARTLRGRLHQLAGLRPGVVLSDTAGRPWRDGQTDFALGAAGVAVTDDLRGVLDTAGQPMEVTIRAVADELAAAADLVKGKLTGLPAAVIRGLPQAVSVDDGPGAAALLRRPADDWFRYGHAEAVRAALGVALDAVAPPTIPPGSPAARLARALDVALAATGPLPAASFHRTDQGERTEITLAPAGVRHRDWLSLGALAQRIETACWAEDLAVAIAVVPEAPAVLVVQLAAGGEAH
jgi:coenzyme F420-0:L-glutamate ligase/coenzyme F420-1:gamma-L-glutamate ligase